MNKKEIEKNRLDLSYQRNLQLLNAVLLLGLGTAISYFISIIINPVQERIFQYTIIGFIIGIITYIIYKRINKNLKNISSEIKKLGRK